MIVQDGDFTPKNKVIKSKNPQRGQKSDGALAPPASPSLDAKQYTFNIMKNAWITKLVISVIGIGSYGDYRPIWKNSYRSYTGLGRQDQVQYTEEMEMFQDVDDDDPYLSREKLR